jgi:HSP20 family protein
MAMTWDPFRDLDRLAASMLDSSQGPRMMPIDLHRDGDHYVLSADLPGVDPGSIDSDIDGQLLTVRAERTLRTDENVRWLVHERPSGSFLRQLTLGEGIDTAGISAHYDNGVLSVIIPVSERAKPRKVEVRSSADDVVTPEVTTGGN